MSQIMSDESLYNLVRDLLVKVDKLREEVENLKKVPLSQHHNHYYHTQQPRQPHQLPNDTGNPIPRNSWSTCG